MKRFRNLVALMFCLISVGILASCDNSGSYQVSFNEKSITLEVGETKSLKDLISLKVATIDNVVFTTSDNTVVYIKPNNEIEGLKNGTAIIEAKAGNSRDYLNIVVSSPLTYFSAVTNLKFSNDENKQTNNVTWNHAYIINSGKEIFAKEYEVSITANGQTTVETVTHNYYEIKSAGEYLVTVVAKADGYINSLPCTISFNCIATPQNLSYDKSTQILSWDAVEGATYKVTYDDYGTDILTNSLNINFNLAGEHKIVVRAKVGSDWSRSSETLTITRLTSPSVTIENGVLHFDLTQASLTSKYVIKVEDSFGLTSYIDNTTGTYYLEGFNPNNYYISVTAIGNNKNILDSLNPEITTVEKLSSPTLSFDVVTKTFTVSIFQNTSIVVVNEVTGEKEITNLTAGAFTLEKQSGIFNVYAYIKASGNQIQSDNSNNIHVKILSSISQLRHTSENDKSVVSFKAVSGAEGYKILVDGTNETFVMTEGDVLNFALDRLTSEIFQQAKIYILTVEALDDTFEKQGSDYYLITNNSSNDSLNITRLADVTLSYENKIISWQPIENAINYHIKFFKNDELIFEGDQMTTSYDISGQHFGNYKFEIKAIGNNQTNLESFNYASIEMQVKEVLAMPSFEFNRLTNELVIGAVENADSYQILLNSNPYQIVNSASSVYVGDLFTSAGEYQFGVYAYSVANSADNDGTGNLYKSETTSFSVEKLPSISSITLKSTYEITVDTEITDDVLAPEKYVYTVNGEVATDLNQILLENQLIVAIKLLANNTLIKPYYLDSDFNTFTFERFPSTTSLSYADNNISWQAVSGATTYELSLKVDEAIHTFFFNTNTVSLEEFKNEPYYQSMIRQGFSFSVRVFVDSVTVLAGETGKICSLASENYVVSVLTAPEITLVSFDNEITQGNITVTWSQIQNATSYTVSVNGVIETTTNNYFTFANVSNVTTYDFTVFATASNYLASEKGSLIFNKLTSPTTINIDDNEKVTVTNIPENAKDTLFNDIAYENDEYSLSSVESTADLTVRFLGAGLLNGHYYLNSPISSYSFTRLAKVTDVQIENNEITWEVNAYADKYEIRLVSQAGEEKIIKIDAKIAETYVHSLSLLDSELLDFTTDSGIYSVYIKALKNGYTLLSPSNTLGTLGSLQSDQTTFGKLDTVINLVLKAENTPEQLSTTLTFDAVVSATSYDIYINDNLYATVYTNSYTTSDLTYDNQVANNGEFTIKVIANANNFIASNISSSITTRRLPNVIKSSLKISPKGIFSWAPISESSGYYVYYKKQNEVSTTPISALNVLFDWSDIFASDNFTGNVDFFVLANGDGSATLSSTYISSTKIRLDSPVVTMTGSNLKIAESILDPFASFNLTVKFDNGTNIYTLKNEVISKNVEYTFPDVWTYQGQEITENGTYIFQIYTFDNDSIDSPLVSITRQKLSEVTMLGLTKLTGDEQKIVLKASAGSLASNNAVIYSLYVNNYEDSLTVPDGEGNLVYNLTDAFEYQVYAGSFTISIQAKLDGYLNSKKATISGLRLNPLTTLSGKNGDLSWNLTNQMYASGYLLRVVHNETVFDYKVKTILQSFDSLEGLSGNIVANIKVLGNLQVGTLITKDIILDSTYMYSVTLGGEVIINENNFTGYKLIKPTSLSISAGMFKVTTTAQATGYLAKDATNRTYELSTVDYEDGSSYGVSEGFYSGANALLLNTTYTFSVRATSNKDNILSSDYTSTVDFQVMPNPNTKVSDFTFTWSNTNINDVVITWKGQSGFGVLAYAYYYELVGTGMKDDVIKQTRDANVIQDGTTFTFDCDKYTLSGNYTFQVRVVPAVCLGTNYIMSAFSPKLEFQKLAEPEVKVQDGKLVWDTITNANGYYIYYCVKTTDTEEVLDTLIATHNEYQYMQDKAFWELPDNFGSLTENVTYYMAVRAVNTNSTLLYAPSMLGAIYQYIGDKTTGEGEYTEDLRAVTKLKAPDEFKLIDGTLIWKASGLDYNYTVNVLTQSVTLNGGTSPFNYAKDISELQNLNIIIRLTDPENVVRTYTVPAYKFFAAEVTSTEMFKLIASGMGIPSDFEFGWPVKDWFTTEIGSAVVAGLQHMSICQAGNDYDWLNSMYSSGFDIWVPNKPQASISNYVLSWNAVTLPTSTYAYTAENKYVVIAQDEFKARKEIYNTNDLSIDLRTLVNDGTLPAGKYDLYVIVNGDSSMYVNGLPSNPISITVLPTVSASISTGVLDWNSITQAVTYNVILDPNDINYRYESKKSSGPWNFDEIAVTNALGEILTYRLTIQAIGNGTTIISGKVTDLGQIIKLATPQLTVSQGIFKWQNITSNEGYLMLVTDSSNVLSEITLTKDRVFYESTITGFNNYNMRALGTTVGALSSASQSYAISSKSENGVYAVMLPSVTEVRAHEGNLLWTNVRELNNSSVAGYKISFDDINFYEAVFVTQFSPVQIGNDSYVVYKIDSTYLAGTYKVYIQPYSENSYYNSTDGKTYKYLLGGILQEQSSVEFIKLQNVSDIKAENGIIHWSANDSLSNNYRIIFTRASQIVEFTVTTNLFDPANLSAEDQAKYDTLIAGEQYSVKIQTLGNEEDLINSDIIESLGYIKLATVSSVEYRVDENGEEGFVIRWLYSGYLDEITDYHYVIRYNNGSEETFTIDSRTSDKITRGYLESSDSYYGEIDGSSLLSGDSKQLSFTIAIVPITTAFVLTSSFSEERSLTPPTSLNGEFSYNSAARKISWTYDANGTEVSFRIIDDIVTVDENNNVSLVETRVYTSQVNEFYPEVIGLHRISISVMLTGAQVASSYVYFNYLTAEVGILNNENFVVTNNGENQAYTLLNFNLFSNGDGSVEKPYLISSQTDFENINQRLTKPSYLGDGVFNFKQTQALSMILSTSIGAFGGVYDGNNYGLTWQLSNASNTKVGLFASVEPTATIKNVLISGKIIQQEDLLISTLYLSALASDNYGLITNSQVKSFTFETTMSRGIDYYYGSFASVNYGTITNSVNTASITFDGNSAQASVRNSKVFIGGIAYNNSKTTKSGTPYIGTISCVGNTGTIKVVANSVSVGGVVASTNTDSTIEKAYNKGMINVTLSSQTSTTNYIGGLVAYNQGRITNSYSVGSSITANISSYSRTIYIGGLCGYISGVNGAVISNCYTITTNITLTNASQVNAQIGLLVGLSAAQDTLVQTKSYYTPVQGFAAINSSPNGFNIGTISSYTNLLTALNAADYAYAQGSTYPILIWESSFTIR